MPDTTGGLYTVKQAAALTGVLETTLRVWERRYGVVTPVRSAGGYRLYDDEQLARLRRMASLVGEGVPASVAARSLAPAGGDPADGSVGPPASSGAVEAPGSAGSPDRTPPDLVAAASSLDPARLDATLAAGLAGPLDPALDGWLLPELKRLGDAWASGELSVAHEHFASAGVLRALGELVHDAPEAGAERPVLVGLPPGVRHELGLLAFAASLRRRGVRVVYLGADVPVPDWLVAASTLLPRAAVVGVPTGSRAPSAQAVVDALATVTPPVAVWVGGGNATRVHGAATLPESVAASAQEVATALGAGLV